MLSTLNNNIKYDIKGNYNYILQNSGRTTAFLYLSKKSFQLCRAILLNKKKFFQDVEFYDTWF